jgi:crossover junction endodeoxyribonuclease RusA
MTTDTATGAAIPTIAIVLPWPHKSLSPNARVHHMAKAREVKKHRQLARWATPARLQVEAERLAVTVTFNPPSRRRMDADNLMASVKSFLDGIADALGIDDNRFDLRAPVVGPVVKNGRVVVEVANG